MFTDWFKSIRSIGKSYIVWYKIKFSNKYQTKTNIPEVGVRATYKKLEVPSLEEGFSEIFQVLIIGNGEFLIKKLI